MRWWREFPLADRSISKNDAIDPDGTIRLKRLNRTEYCDAEKPAEETNILKLCGHCLLGGHTEVNAGSKHVAKSSGLGFKGNCTCFSWLDNSQPGSSCSQLISAPPPPFEAFLIHGIREQLLRVGWGTIVPYKKGSGVPYEEYSKLFDAYGYYKLNWKRPVVWEVVSGQKRSDTYAGVYEENENSMLYGFPPEKKNSVCKKWESSEQLLSADGSTMRRKRSVHEENENATHYGCPPEKKKSVCKKQESIEQLLDYDSIMREFHDAAVRYNIPIPFEEQDGSFEIEFCNPKEETEETEDDESEQDSGSDEDLLVKRAHISSWACINFSGMDEKETSHFIHELRLTCVAIEIGMNPCPVVLENGKSALPTDIENTLFAMHVELSAIFSKPSVRGDQLGLLIIILPDKQESHDKVEEVCESLGVVYQCCSSQDARTPSKKYLKDTAHQIKKKVLRLDAGLLRPIVHTAIPFMADAPTLIFGGDIIPRSSQISVASVVALMDWPGTNIYRALVSSQPCNEVLIKDLNRLLSELVCAFHKGTEKMPTRIIYFRNGVIEGQLSHTFKHEMDVIRVVCPQAQITFVVVSQRLSHELLGSEIGEANFSCSHVEEGSNTLVSYHVLHDDNHLTADKLSSLCNDLRNPRIRWTFPKMLMAPPAYFAQKAALMARKPKYFKEHASKTLAGTCEVPKILF